jgi:hypothetical protein
MQNFIDRFKPKTSGNLLAGFRGGSTKFSGPGQSLGGTLPGKVIAVELTEAGSLGIKLEKRPNGSCVVALVIPNSQADRFGLERGDILCFAGSNGAEEIQYDMFLQLAASDQRPVCFEVRRIQTKKDVVVSTASKSKSADEHARKQAVIAAAEAREKAHVKKQKPMARKTLSTEERLKQQQQPSTLQEPTQSEESLRAQQEIKRKEAETAAQLGYNPYEPSRATAGQARNATVVATHGTIHAGSDATSVPTTAAPEQDVSFEFEEALQHLIAYNTHKDPAQVASSMNVLCTLLVNATTKGQDGSSADEGAKFCRVRLENAKIKAAVVDVEGALQVLLALGFELHEQDGESILLYGNKPDWLPAALQQMQQYKA